MAPPATARQPVVRIDTKSARRNAAIISVLNEVEYSRGVRPPVHTLLPAIAHLTAREQDAFQLLGRALSNAEIAAKLHLSESTMSPTSNSPFDQLELHERA